MRRFRIDTYYLCGEFHKGDSRADFFDDLEMAMESLTVYWNNHIDGVPTREFPDELAEDLCSRTCIVVDTFYQCPVRIVSYHELAESGLPLMRVWDVQEGTTVTVQIGVPNDRRMKFEVLKKGIADATPADLDILAGMIQKRQATKQRAGPVVQVTA